MAKLSYSVGFAKHFCLYPYIILMSVATIQPDKADQNDLIFDGNKCSFDVKIIGGMS